MIKRMRRIKLKAKTKIVYIKQKQERRDKIRMEKAEKIALVNTEIEKELMDRLKLGTYETQYDDLLNLNPTAFENVVNKMNLAVE